MRLIIWLIAASSIALGCSNSATGPTSPAGPDPVPLANLRWDGSVPGCPAQPPPAPLPDAGQALLEPGPHGSILARFPYRSESGRPVVLVATLVERGTDLVVCGWDIADL